MTDNGFKTINREELEERIRERQPDNDDRTSGYALINVLPAEEFEKKHIPGSINIPQSRIGEFERKYAKDKEIILYCASPDCPASPDTARELAKRGYSNIYDYEAGLSDWKEAGDPVEGREAA